MCWVGFRMESHLGLPREASRDLLAARYSGAAGRHLGSGLSGPHRFRRLQARAAAFFPVLAGGSCFGTG
jgi:hypothetical protein